MTLLEVIIASFFVAFLLTASINLLSRVYMGILASQLKTYSFNLATEHLEMMKSFNFGALKVTPDSMLPYEPLSNLESSNNPWGNPADPDNIEMMGGVPMRVYKIVQFAEETQDGSIIPKKQSEMRYDADKNLKMLKVIVTYPFTHDTETITKRTEFMSYISESESSFGGCTIRGRVQKRDKSTGRPDPPGFAARVWVYIEGFPQYTTRVDTSNTDGGYRGYYTINNIMPGTYRIYAQGDGYDRGEYAGNPLTITIDDVEINGINIVTPQSNNYTIAGNIYDPDGNPVSPLGYSKIEIRANDGMSSTVTVNSSGQYEITNVDSDGRTITVTAVFSKESSNETFYGQYLNIPHTGGNNYNITLAIAADFGMVSVFAKDARDRSSPIPGMNLILVDSATNTVPANGYGVTDGGGSHTFMNIPPGNYSVSGALAYWSPEKGDPFRNVAVTPFTEDVVLYFFPTGDISGTITEVITNLPPDKTINVSAFSSGQKVAETTTNVSTGYYLLENVHVSPYNRVRIYVDGSVFDYHNPSNGTLDGVVVNHMATTTDQNFSIIMAYKEISGSIRIDFGQGETLINEGVMIVAQPTSNTVSPHVYSLDNSSAVYRAQNPLRRRQYPAYGMMSKRNGTYTISVPMGTNYDIYAYYSRIEYSSTDPSDTGTLQKYYKKLSSVAPGAASQNFSGAWTPY